MNALPHHAAKPVAPAEAHTTPMISVAGAHAIRAAGQTLLLLPQRAVYWPAASTIFVADLHLGKVSTFAAAGAPIDVDLCARIAHDDLRRLDALFALTDARRLVVLGDLLHARAGRSDAVFAAGKTMFSSGALSRAERLLIRGNHDDRAGDPPDSWGFTCMNEPYADGPLTLRHVPPPAQSAGYFLAGHIHPAVRISGPGGDAARVPCFLASDDGLVLPAFGVFTGGTERGRDPRHTVYAATPSRVAPLPTPRGR